MSELYVQAARGLYGAFNAGDLATFEKACSSEFVWNEAESSLYSAGNPYRNFKQVLDGVFEPTMRDFDGFRCDLEKLIDGGDYVIGTGRYHGKCRATGKQLSAQFCHVLHFDREARLDGVQEYADTLAEAEATGRVKSAEEIELRQPMPV